MASSPTQCLWATPSSVSYCKPADAIGQGGPQVSEMASVSHTLATPPALLASVAGPPPADGCISSNAGACKQGGVMVLSTALPPTRSVAGAAPLALHGFIPPPPPVSLGLLPAVSAIASLPTISQGGPRVSEMARVSHTLATPPAQLASVVGPPPADQQQYRSMQARWALDRSSPNHSQARGQDYSRPIRGDERATSRQHGPLHTTGGFPCSSAPFGCHHQALPA